MKNWVGIDIERHLKGFRLLVSSPGTKKELAVIERFLILFVPAATLCIAGAVYLFQTETNMNVFAAVVIGLGSLLVGSWQLASSWGRRDVVEKELRQLIDGLESKNNEYEIDLLVSKQQLKQEVENHHQTEKLMLESENQLRLVIDNIPIRIAFIGKDKEILFANMQFCDGLGLPMSDVLRRPVKEVIGHQLYRNVMDHMEEALSGESVSFNDSVPGIDGAPTYLSTQYVPYGKGGFVDGFFMMISDVTENRKMEALLEESQKMEAIGVLARGISHEFNNLLTPIIGFSELILMGKTDNDPDFERLQMINKAGNRAVGLIKQLLAYGRRSLPAREPLALQGILDETVKLIMSTINSNISVRQEIEEELPLVLGVSDELNQLMLNLCVNACHAMPDGGVLLLGIKKAGFCTFMTDDGNVREGNYLDLSIQDAGLGMDKNTVDRIFDPFYTTKKVGEGSGLGLSMVQNIVERHSGHIDVVSRKGIGTTFHIYLPIAMDELKPIKYKAEMTELNVEAKILLVDDEQMIVDYAKSMLESLGYEVVDFVDCEEALRYFKNFPDEFDLVITDYGMPVMNGKQLVSSLKEIRPDIASILTTGYGDLVDKEGISSWGINQLLIKPFERSELHDAVKDILVSIKHSVGTHGRSASRYNVVKNLPYN